MTKLDQQFREALQRGIDHERAACGEETGPPTTGHEWDNAAASTLPSTSPARTAPSSAL